ncbi:hypothetical protein DAPPUDRAFT_47113 [Daphnia pulex]|uniref:PRA1 family protein n=2 Tax=Daphnia TaxID=6668 RepID=E9G780_DAPPU|nr:hypothetical protein DAPPUDRAFT_47113 [Daphnia pulex]|eukprot:EFX84691.1 hypothetical protein DAPPUDRAFT_47113 [Daphnia pulex]
MSLPVKFNLSVPVAQEWLGSRRKNLKPWFRFVQTSKFQSPTSVPALGSRIVKNVDHFQSNYLCIFIILILYCLLTSPLLLFAVGTSLGACYLISRKNDDQKLSILGHELSLAQQYGLIAMVSLPLFYLAGAGSVVFWVLGASMFLIVLHASFYNNESPEESFEQPILQV